MSASLFPYYRERVPDLILKFSLDCFLKYIGKDFLLYSEISRLILSKMFTITLNIWRDCGSMRLRAPRVYQLWCGNNFVVCYYFPNVSSINVKPGLGICSFALVSWSESLVALYLTSNWTICSRCSFVKSNGSESLLSLFTSRATRAIRSLWKSDLLF